MGRPRSGYTFALMRGDEPDLTQTITLPSVTDILGVISKPVLVNWAAKATRVGVAELLQANGLKGATQEELASMLKAKALDHNSLSKAGRERGSGVHGLAETILKGEELTPEQELIAETGAGQACIAWLHENKPEPIAIEQTVVSWRHGFAGTFDLLAYLEGDEEPATMVDFKTGKADAPIYPETHLQTSGYIEGWAETRPGEPQPASALGVVFRDDGTIGEAPLKIDFPAFRAALDLYRFMGGFK